VGKVSKQHPNGKVSSMDGVSAWVDAVVNRALFSIKNIGEIVSGRLVDEATSRKLLCEAHIETTVAYYRTNLSRQLMLLLAIFIL
jgi:hypothetical protein